MARDAEFEKDWVDTWLPAISTRGMLDLEKIKKEFRDLRFLLNNVPLVYEHVTGGQLSKPFWSASAVMASHDEHVEDLLINRIQDLIDDDIDLLFPVHIVPVRDAHPGLTLETLLKAKQELDDMMPLLLTPEDQSQYGSITPEFLGEIRHLFRIKSNPYIPRNMLLMVHPDGRTEFFRLEVEQPKDTPHDQTQKEDEAEDQT